MMRFNLFAKRVGQDRSLGEKSRSQRLRRLLSKSCQSLIHYDDIFENGLIKIDDHHYSFCFSFGDCSYELENDEQKQHVINQYAAILSSIQEEIHFQFLLLSTPQEKARFQFELRGDCDDALRKEYNDHFLNFRKSVSIGKYLILTLPARSRQEAELKCRELTATLYQQFQELAVDLQLINGTERLLLFSKILQKRNYLQYNFHDIALSGLSSKSFIAPEKIKIREKEFQLNQHFYKVIYIRHYPKFLIDGLLKELLYIGLDLVITIQGKPLSLTDVIRLIKKDKNAADIDMIKSIRQGSKEGLPAQLAVAGKAKETSHLAERWQAEIQEKDQTIFKASFSIMLCAKSLDQLNQDYEIINMIARKYMVAFEEVYYYQEQALNHHLPIGYSSFNRQSLYMRDLTTDNLSHHLPFAYQEITSSSQRAICYGQNQLTNQLVILDRKKDLHTGSGLILGTSGSGKSVMAKTGEIIPILLNNPEDRVIIIDPEDEYANLAHHFDAQLISICSGSPHHLNLLDLPSKELLKEEEDSIGQKSNLLMGLFETLLSDLSDEEISIIDRVTRLTYQKVTTPSLKDWYQVLLEQPEESAKKLALKSESYTIGSQNIFSYQTNVDLEKPLIIFNIKKLTGKLKTFALLVIQDYIWNQVVANQGKITTWLYFDELQLYFKYHNQAVFFTELYSRIRKYGAICTGITQNPETLSHSSEGRKLLSNSEFFVLLKLKKTDIMAIEKTITLTESQKSFVLQPKSKGSGLLFAGGVIVPFENTLSKDSQLFQIVSTDT